MVPLSKPLCYRVYVLRLWQERPPSPARAAVWRFSVNDPRTGQRRGFGSLEGLIAFLQAQVGAEKQEGEGETSAPLSPHPERR